MGLLISSGRQLVTVQFVKQRYCMDFLWHAHNSICLCILDQMKLPCGYQRQPHVEYISIVHTQNNPDISNPTPDPEEDEIGT